MVVRLHDRVLHVIWLLGVATLAAGPLRAVPEEVLESPEGARGTVVRVQAVLSSDQRQLELGGKRVAFSNTGFLVSDRGHVLTSLLAVAGCERIEVVTQDAVRSPARLAAIDQPLGLALLQTELSDTSYLKPTAREPTAGDSLSLLHVGENGGVAVEECRGEIARTDQSLRVNACDQTGLFCVRMPYRQGCAAGPLVTEDGQLAGVLLGFRHAPSPSGGEQADAPLAYIFPARRLAPRVKSLLEGKSRRQAWLGLSMAAETDRLEGVRVAAVLDGPAHAAGIRGGDVLLQVNNQPIEGPQTLASFVSRSQPGDVVEIGLMREQRLRTVELRLGERPILIFSGIRRAGDEHVQLRRRQRIHPMSDEELRRIVQQLMAENSRLRRRVEQLEQQRNPAD